MGGRFFVPLIVADIGAPIGCALALSDIRNTIGQSCAPSDAPLASFESRQSVIGRVNRTQSRELSDGRANRLIALANYRIGQTESKNPNQRTDSDLC